MVSTSETPVRPDRLFDLVTGFPPDDAIDLVVPVPLSLAIYMTMLESTGHAAPVAALRKIHDHEASVTARAVQATVGFVHGPDGPEPARLALAHVVEERVPRVNGVRPHLHVYVGGTAVALADGRRAPIDIDLLAARADSDLFPDHRDRLATASAERLGLVWGEASAGSLEILEPAWLAERAGQLLRDGEPFCPGPFARRRVVAGERHLRRVGEELRDAPGP
ncbi:hypothetical protein PHK61_12135 [Actinomycetospora lutea]|uniref:hypothetical protein n=1 Tax=Actinomycetospora lutea TaxID=663604 RepID=UPI0023658B19|nr:hypothetical protein [Actinomycetospora lutea]MDD7939165.1 hypothetical protein [Actinomycetospora lutea]